MNTIDKISEQPNKPNKIKNITYALAISGVLLGSPINAQENKNSLTKIENIDSQKNKLKQILIDEDFAFYSRALDQFHEDEYLRQNTNAIFDATIGRLPTPEERIYGKIFAINLLFPDSAKQVEYIHTTPNINIELENFMDIYKNRWTDYTKYLSKEEKRLAKNKRKRNAEGNETINDKSPFKKPNYVLEVQRTTSYLSDSKDFVKENFPLDAEIMLTCIQHCESDEYFKTNIEQMIDQNLSRVPEKERDIAILEAISIITKGAQLKDGNVVEGTFSQRNHITLSKKTRSHIKQFLSDFSFFSHRYNKYTKEIRKF